MQKNYLKNLTSACEEAAQNDDHIFDIIIYGSATRGKENPSDVDIAIIFYNLPLKEQLEIISQFKQSIKKIISSIDVKGMNIRDFFNPDILSRQGIIMEGKSLVDGKTLAGKMGFKGTAIFSYTLEGLTHTEKIRFNYSMKGRGMKGLLDSLNGTAFGRGTVSVPIENSDEFEQFLKKWKIKFSKKRMLEERY